MVQILTLFVFVALILGSINVSTQDAQFAKILRNTNLSSLLVWSYWWPIIIVTAIFFGRFWCSICPMELITSFFSKIGFKRKPGRFLKSGWLITILYGFILLVGIHTFSIHRVPQYMAIYLLLLFLGAVLVGLYWEKRTFCTYVCPVGHLLGLYSLLSFKKLRVKNQEVCKSCQTKDCIAPANHYKNIGRSCTSELYPKTLQNNKDCILCGHCFKSCTHQNIVIKNRPLGADLFKDISLSWAEISFFVMLSGFVVYEVLSEWKMSKTMLMVLPKAINKQLLIPTEYTGTIKAILLFVVLPALFYFVFAGLKKYTSKRSWKQVFTQLVLSILPITASMHLLKAFLKTTSRLPYWSYALNDYKGVESAYAIMADPASLPRDILELIYPIISVLALFLSVSGMALSFYVISKQKSPISSRIISYSFALFYGGLFLVCLYAWRY